MSGAAAAVTAVVVTAAVMLLGAGRPPAQRWGLAGPSGRPMGSAGPVQRLRSIAGRARPSRSRWGSRAPGNDVAQAALAADLVVAALDAGAPIGSALSATADAVGGDVGACLHAALRRLELGMDGAGAAEPLGCADRMAPLARAIARAARTGMPPADVLGGVAERERARATSTRRARARAAGSLAAVPLGLLVLPAFVLVAVVPTVIGALSGVLGLP